LGSWFPIHPQQRREWMGHRALKGRPQGLKPGFFLTAFGTTEVVPCYKAFANHY
jgi:hypothetical protein